MRLVNPMYFLCVSLVGSMSYGGDAVPAPISRHPSEVVAAWNEVSILVRENELLDNPLPEPYVARGDVWRSVGCHEDALADYLKAVELATANNPGLAEKSRLLSRLHQALQGQPCEAEIYW